MIIDPPFGDYSESGSLNEDEVSAFREIIYAYYGEYGRSFPWRETEDPYEVLVSEIMLQQTQTDRVTPKYAQFLSAWPDMPSLASATLAGVYDVWRGLGYNRRAKALVDIARLVTREMNGVLPDSFEELLSLPMVGRATAAAIRNFAYGEPEVYIETNVRRVYIYFFFEGRREVNDRELIPLVDATMDRGDPRQWYYALMDYGVLLKKRVVNPNRRSAHYSRQAPYKGSDREIRGRILRYLADHGRSGSDRLLRDLDSRPQRLTKCLADLVAEGLVVKETAGYRIGD